LFFFLVVKTVSFFENDVGFHYDFLSSFSFKIVFLLLFFYYLISNFGFIDFANKKYEEIKLPGVDNFCYTIDNRQCLIE